MIDFFLGAALTGSFANPPEISQSVIIAQAQTALVYLPVTTTQSKTPKCITFTARNTSSRTVRDPSVNYTNSAGRMTKMRLSKSSLKSGETVTFNLCQGQNFANVEAKQQ